MPARPLSVPCPICDGVGVTRPGASLIGTAIGIPSYRSAQRECGACRGSGRIRPAAHRRSGFLAGLRPRLSSAA